MIHVHRSQVIALLLLFSCSSLTQANPYLEHAKTVIRLDKSLAEATAELKVIEGFSTSLKYVSTVHDNLRAAAFEHRNRFEDLRTYHQDLFSSSPSGSYENQLQTAMWNQWLFRQRVPAIKGEIKQLKMAALQLLGLQTSLESFCQTFIPLMNVAELKANPAPTYTGSFAYQSLGHVLSGGAGPNLLSEDPRANMIGILALPVSIAAGIISYAIFSGVGISAALSLFSVSASNGAFALAGTGVGAVIVIAAVVTSLLVTKYFTEKEDRKRKKAAEDKYNAEVQLFTEAKDWYDTHKLTTTEWQQYAYNTCRNPKVISIVAEHLEQVEGAFTDTHAFLGSLEWELEELVQMDQQTTLVVQNADTQLQNAFVEAYIEKLKSENIEARNFQALVDFYQNTAKNKLKSLYYAELNFAQDCFLLENELVSVINPLVLKMAPFRVLNFVTSEAKDYYNFVSTTIDNQVRKAKDIVKKCFVKIGMITPPSEQMPYEFH